jgi:hypothetical protein
MTKKDLDLLRKRITDAINQMIKDEIINRNQGVAIELRIYRCIDSVYFKNP